MVGVGSCNVADLDLPAEVREHLAGAWGIEELYPPQAAAMPAVLAGESVLLAAPTASGKSLVAYLAILRRLLVDEIGSRAIYIVPLKALASEKVDELNELCGAVGLSVGIGVGDRSNESKKLDEADVLVCTSEKFDSLLRNRERFLEGVSVVIADEIHLVHDVGRGPTLEVNLARIMHERPDAQLVALSATVGNAEAVAGWLGAKLITSDWRPVPLSYATESELLVEVRKEVHPDGGEPKLPAPRTLDGPKTAPVWAVLKDTLEEGGQMLCFVGTRRSAQSAARDLGKRRLKTLIEAGEEELIKELALLSERMKGSEDGSHMADILAEVITGGVAFHHAGLTSRQRRLIETAFKERTLVALCATPTLAAGVNLPARRVLVRDLRRWDGSGNHLLSVMEVQQMLGRAGRPGYDLRGDAWLHCKTQEQADAMAELYFLSEPEDIVSKLHMESPMRMHVLAAVATGGQRSRHALGRFFSLTFLAQDLPREILADNVDGILDWLCEHGMVERLGIDERLAADIEASEEERRALATSEAEIEDWDDEMPPWASAAKSTPGVRLDDLLPKEKRQKPPRKGPAVIGFQSAADVMRGSRLEPTTPEQDAMAYAPTAFGERVSRLYLDPLSGHILRKGVRRATAILAGLDEETTLSPFGLLHLITTVPDFMQLWPRKNEIELLQTVHSATEGQRLVSREDLQESHLDLDPLIHAKSAAALEGWIDELSNRRIESSLGVAPGDLRVRTDLCEWLLYACREIVRNDEGEDELLGPAREKLVELIDEVRLRVRHGCRTDLLQLVSLRTVGRVRARKMAGLGVRTLTDVVEMTERDQRKLADEQGWSIQLVEGIVTQARQLSGRKKRR
jgi:helicase